MSRINTEVRLTNQDLTRIQSWYNLAFGRIDPEDIPEDDDFTMMKVLFIQNVLLENKIEDYKDLWDFYNYRLGEKK